MQTRLNDMLDMLDSPIPAIRARAILLLGHEEHMLPLERLDQLYEDGDSATRVAILKYLARNLPPGHTKIALKALTDMTNSVRLVAVEYLIAHPDKKAAPILEILLKSPDFSRKDLVIRALEVCDDGRAISLLLPILEDEQHTSRLLAAGIIARHDVRPVIDKVLQLLASEDEITVRVAISVLAYFKDDLIIAPVLTVIEKWRSTPQLSRLTFEAISLLDKFHDPRIRDALLQFVSANDFNHYNQMARTSAIHILGNYPEPQIIQLLVGLLRNGDQSDRHSVTQAFIKIGGSAAVDALIANLPFETDSSVLAKYSYAFAELGDKRAVPVLEELLNRVDSLHKTSIETNLRALNPPPPAKPNHANIITALKSRLRPHC